MFMFKKKSCDTKAMSSQCNKIKVVRPMTVEEKRWEGVYWDCSECGRTNTVARGICRCGRTNADQRHYIIINGAKYYNIDKAHKDDDWFCDYCNTINAAKYTECCNCGSPNKNRKTFKYGGFIYKKEA